ncbi:MAG: M48 family metalloprotease [Phycisphaerales bacterium]|nr:MAG: M48 family metalloprotease [Phycisphaerales bacterium]
MLRIYPAIVMACALGCHAPDSGSWTCPPALHEAEALAGARAASALEARHGGVFRDATAEARLERVGEKFLARLPGQHSKYRYRLLDSDGVNAFSLPGGLVYVTRGLYGRLVSDGLLAAALAHEMAHMVARDHFKPRCGDLACALNRELLADTHATRLLEAANLPTTAMAELVNIIHDVRPTGWVDSRAANLKILPEQPRATLALHDFRKFDHIYISSSLFNSVRRVA